MKRTLLLACTCSLCLMLFSSCEKEKQTPELTPGKTEAELLAEYEPMFRSYLPYQKGEQVALTSSDTTIVFTVEKDEFVVDVQPVLNKDFLYYAAHEMKWVNEDMTISFGNGYTSGGLYCEYEEIGDEDDEEYLENWVYRRKDRLGCEVKVVKNTEKNFSDFIECLFIIYACAYNSTTYDRDTLVLVTGGSNYMQIVHGVGVSEIYQKIEDYNPISKDFDKKEIIWTVTRQ